jgi:putative MFS transporter
MPDGPPDPAPRTRRPWWLPFPIPAGVESAHVQLLGLVSFAMLFENYDIGLMGAALPQIAAEFGLSNPEKGSLMGSIEMGALLAFIVVPFADRVGRRKVLLASIIGMSVGSFLTGLAPTAQALAACQIITRTFATSASVVSFVIVAEEFPADHRGWGLGVLGAVGAVGFGLGALVYAQIGWLPYGWRSIYVLGGFAVLLVPFFRRRLKETRRFQASPAAQERGNLLRGALRPVVALVRSHPRRALVLGAMAFFSTAGHRPAFRFVSDFVQTQHGWTPGEYARMTILLGAIGVAGSPLMGRLGDRFGRRLIGAAMLLPFPLFAGLFYSGPVRIIAFGWTAMVFVSMAAGVVQRALATELFSTDTRSSAGGWILLVETLGAALGLYLFAGLETVLDDWGRSLALVAGLAAVGAVFLIFLPDTHRRELETISDAPVPPDAAAG